MTKQKGKSGGLNIPVHFRFSKAELINHVINVPDQFDTGSPSKFKYQLAIKYKNDQKGLATITLEYSLLYNDKVAFSMTTNNDFIVLEDDLKKYKNTDTERRFARHIAELSLLHSRGIQSNLINGTQLESFYIPYVPQSELFSSDNTKTDLVSV